MHVDSNSMVCSATFLGNLTHRFLQWLVQKCKLHSEFRAWIQDPQIPLSMQDRQIHQSSRPRDSATIVGCKMFTLTDLGILSFSRNGVESPVLYWATSDGIGGRLKLLANWLLYGTIGANIFIRGPNSVVPSDWNAIAEILWSPASKSRTQSMVPASLERCFSCGCSTIGQPNTPSWIFVSQCCPATCRKSWSQQFSSKYFLKYDRA